MASGRLFVGILWMLALFFIWGFLALGAGYFVLASENWLVRGAYYVIAGVGWLPFAMPIVGYMARGPRHS
ncbi:hypothetical protein A33M_2432 [Rhodovulum sp. PH10]|uniref:DUF2842 domain-containing protein n=1 Tax=Rhodovulum sp. PH10 TaxID=1187851 RepID=UPI00027C2C17|nr:DUF2842 domain-containing protein [Rhodovulum sp. PH10]EJW12052.1 hypothetical protein A33M_2432 [Rhodovulum sp. PH10]